MSQSSYENMKRINILFAFPLKGLLCASVRCGHSAEAVNKAWSQISLRCPLLLVSTVVMFVIIKTNAATYIIKIKKEKFVRLK